MGKNILELYTRLFGHKAVITVLALFLDLGSTGWGLLVRLRPTGSVCVLSAYQSTRPSTGAHRSQRNDEGYSKRLIRKRSYLHFFLFLPHYHPHFTDVDTKQRVKKNNQFT